MDVGRLWVQIQGRWCLSGLIDIEVLDIGRFGFSGRYEVDNLFPRILLR